MDSLTDPSPRDRTLAATMHVATIFAPIVAPVVALAIGRRSPFLTAHGKRSLQETLLIQFALLVVGICSLTYTVISLYGHYQSGWRDFSLIPFLVRFLIGWILLGILSLVNVAMALRSALRAYRGEWPTRRAPVPAPVR